VWENVPFRGYGQSLKQAVVLGLKSRGFDIESSHLRHPDRLSRLLMIISIALYWCVSAGAEAEEGNPVLKKEVYALGLREG
jgi:hypothetical protein